MHLSIYTNPETLTTSVLTIVEFLTLHCDVLSEVLVTVHTSSKLLLS